MMAVMMCLYYFCHVSVCVVAHYNKQYKLFLLIISSEMSWAQCDNVAVWLLLIMEVVTKVNT